MSGLQFKVFQSSFTTGYRFFICLKKMACEIKAESGLRSKNVVRHLIRAHKNMVSAEVIACMPMKNCCYTVPAHKNFINIRRKRIFLKPILVYSRYIEKTNA